MKPCATHEEAITLLALGEELDAQSQANLAEHLKTCSTCRQCHEQALKVARELSAMGDAGIHRPVSDGFHDRLKLAIQSEPQERYGFRTVTVRWWTLALATAASVALLLLVIQPGSHSGPIHVASVVPNPASTAASPFEPTLGAYQDAVRRSSDVLDQMLRRAPSPIATPETQMTASQLTRIEWDVN
jgi:anti-sigma factor RsiW